MRRGRRNPNKAFATAAGGRVLHMRETYHAEQEKTKDDTSFISVHQTQTIIIINSLNSFWRDESTSWKCFNSVVRIWWNVKGIIMNRWETQRKKAERLLTKWECGHVNTICPGKDVMKPNKQRSWGKRWKENVTLHQKLFTLFDQESPAIYSVIECVINNIRT